MSVVGKSRYPQLHKPKNYQRIILNMFAPALGVDFGTLNTVIAVARNRGVDVVGECPTPKEERTRDLMDSISIPRRGHMY